MNKKELPKGPPLRDIKTPIENYNSVLLVILLGFIIGPFLGLLLLNLNSCSREDVIKETKIIYRDTCRNQ